MMKTLTKIAASVLAISVMLTSAVAAQVETKQDQPPNILFILADDLGYGERGQGIRKKGVRTIFRGK